MHAPLLQDIATIFGLSIVVLLFCHRIRLPNIVGFLLTGILCGPHGLGLIHAENDVQTLAEVGIILLLFIVGMEFSFKQLLAYKRYFLIGGTIQVGLTVLAGFCIGFLAGRPLGESIFLGCLLSLSSTAIVLRLLAEKRESDSPHGRVIVGMMIFQDIIAIPMMLMIPFFAGVGDGWHVESLYAIGKGIAVLAFVLFSAVKLIPKLLYHIAKTRNRELFLLTVFTICSSVAWITSSIGLSLSLGAFLAGLIISDSEYRAEAIGDILPFQDIFTSFFFVSIGMLLNLEFFFNEPFYIMAVALGILSMKAIIAGLAAWALGMPLRTVVLTAVAMSQIGEFSFVLAKASSAFELGSQYHYQLFLAVALLTMAVAPSLMNGSSTLASWILRLPLPAWVKTGLKAPQNQEKQTLKDHIIIIGFGISGRHLASSARKANIPYLIVDMNAKTVKEEKLRGEPIHFGDATHETILQHAHIDEAKTLAVVINDPKAAGRVVELARKLNPHLYIVVRTRYLLEMKEMYGLGADDVVPDEFGSSIEVFTRVLRKYEVPMEQVSEIVTSMRIEGYDMLRLLYQEPESTDLRIASTEVIVNTFHIQNQSLAANKTLGELDLRKSFGVTVMLIKRGTHKIVSPDAATILQVRDVVVVAGIKENLIKATSLFKTAPLLAESIERGLDGALS